jgi:hypothetical protein
MNSRKSIQRALLMVLAVLSVVCASSAQINQKTRSWGKPVNGLQISLSLDPATAPPSTIPALALHLRNVGASSLRIILGERGAPPMIGPNSAVRLNLTDLSGSSNRLIDLRPLFHQAGYVGAAVVLAVYLSPGEEQSVPLELNKYKYFSTVTHRYEQVGEPGGTYSLQAEIEIKSTANFQDGWKGLVTSDKLEIHFPSR